MGAKGSSSHGYAGLFQTREGEEEYFRRMNLLHGRATPGQRDGIVGEVREWEKKYTIGLQQTREYDDIMLAQEIFEQLTKEGKS